MGAFEVQNTTAEVEPMFGSGHEGGNEDSSCSHGKVMDECIIAYKVYDSCRRQNCNIILRYSKK